MRWESGAVGGQVYNHYTRIKTRRVLLVDGLQMKHNKEMLLRGLNENLGLAQQRGSVGTSAANNMLLDDATLRQQTGKNDIWFHTTVAHRPFSPALV